MAFEAEGFVVVRGPDVIFGGDVRDFHPPAGRFDGVIGGPPCQAFSQANQMGRLGRQRLAVNLIPEFERCVREANPAWFLMENVKQAPLPFVPGYVVRPVLFNNRDAGGVQNRVRRFSFGTTDGRALPVRPVALQAAEYAPCVTANGAQWDSRRQRIARGLEDVRPRSRSDRSSRMLAHYIRWQGLPADFLSNAPFTLKEKVRLVGNGVPLPMGRAHSSSRTSGARPSSGGAVGASLMTEPTKSCEPSAGSSTSTCTTRRPSEDRVRSTRARTGSTRSGRRQPRRASQSYATLGAHLQTVGTRGLFGEDRIGINALGGFLDSPVPDGPAEMVQRAVFAAHVGFNVSRVHPDTALLRQRLSDHLCVHRSLRASHYATKVALVPSFVNRNRVGCKSLILREPTKRAAQERSPWKGGAPKSREVASALPNPRALGRVVAIARAAQARPLSSWARKVKR